MAAAQSQVPRLSFKFQSDVDSHPVAVRRHRFSSDANFGPSMGVVFVDCVAGRIFLLKKPWACGRVSADAASNWQAVIKDIAKPAMGCRINAKPRSRNRRVFAIPGIEGQLMRQSEPYDETGNERTIS